MIQWSMQQRVLRWLLHIWSLGVALFCLRLCSLGWPGTHVDQAGPGITEVHLPLPFRCWGLKMCATTLSPVSWCLKEALFARVAVYLCFYLRVVYGREALFLDHSTWQSLVNGDLLTKLCALFIYTLYPVGVHRGSQPLSFREYIESLIL